MKYESTNLTAN